MTTAGDNKPLLQELLTALRAMTEELKRDANVITQDEAGQLVMAIQRLREGIAYRYQPGGYHIEGGPLRDEYQ